MLYLFQAQIIEDKNYLTWSLYETVKILSTTLNKIMDALILLYFNEMQRN